MSTVCGIPEQKLRVVAPDVGGGFGGKLNVYAEEAIALAVARRLGRPVKWTASRGEDYQATTHGRDMIQDVEIAANRDGRVLGLKVDPHRRHGGLPSDPHPSRAAARPVRLSRHLQVRRLRLLLPGCLHHQDPDGLLPRRRPPGGDVRHRADHGRAGRRARHGLAGAATAELDHHARVPVHDDRRADLRQRRLRGGHRPRHRAVRLRRAAARTGGAAPARRPRCSLASVSPHIPRWAAWHLPAGWASMATPPAAGRRPACACCPPEGSKPWSAPRRTAKAMSPRSARSSPTRLGVSFDDVDVLHGDTDVAPWGLDTYGSRSLVVGGTAALQAARKVVDKARVIAAHLLEASPDDLEFADGRFSVRGDPEAARPSRRSPSRPSQRTTCQRGADPVLLAEATFDPETFSYPARHSSVRGRGRYPDRAGDGTVATSRSTTWGRRSTR